MTVTLEVGQLVVQPYRSGERIWRIDRQAPDDPYGSRRWFMVLIERSLDDESVIGRQSCVSDIWLRDHCHDHTPPVIEPPMGNGTQRCAFQILDGVVAQDVFTAAQDAIDFFATHLTANQGFGVGLWWGCDGWTVNPDMTVTMVDGELVWSD